MTVPGDPVALGPCQCCEQQPAVEVCNVLLAQPVSLAYCRRCLDEEIEAYSIILATVGGCLDGHPAGPPTEALARATMQPWAIVIIDRSLRFHGKTWQDVVADVACILTPPDVLYQRVSAALAALDTQHAQAVFETRRQVAYAIGRSCAATTTLPVVPDPTMHLTAIRDLQEAPTVDFRPTPPKGVPGGW